MSAYSLSSSKIKEIVKLHQKKYREESNLFIVEGYKALEEIINANIEIVEVFAINDIKFPTKNLNISYIDNQTMKKVATTSSPCEILTIAKQKQQNIDTFKNFKKVVLLENISDPGNLGTIIRSAAAFNIDGIILFDDCVELYSPKVIRSSAGNFFKTPIVCLNNIKDLKSIFSDFKFVATALATENNISIKDCKNLDKFVLMFGSEAKGLTKELINIADYNTLIDMSKDVESLNLAVSASILFYHLK